MRPTSGRRAPSFRPTRVHPVGLYRRRNRLPQCHVEQSVCPSPPQRMGRLWAQSGGLAKVTTGGWYLDDLSLHIVLANDRVSITRANMRQSLWEHPLHPDSDSSYNLVAGPPQAIVREPGFALSPFTSSPPHLAMAYQVLPFGEPVPASHSQETSSGNHSATHAPGIVSPPTPIEERLQALTTTAHTRADHRRRIASQEATIARTILIADAPRDSRLLGKPSRLRTQFIFDGGDWLNHLPPSFPAITSETLTTPAPRELRSWFRRLSPFAS